MATRHNFQFSAWKAYTCKFCGASFQSITKSALICSEEKCQRQAKSEAYLRRKARLASKG